MKKVFLSLALVAAMSVSFVSCKEKEAEGTEETMEEVAPVEEVAPEATEEVAPEATEEVAPEATEEVATEPAH